MQSGSGQQPLERVVSKIKNVLSNPFLLGAQGFMVGALLLWSGNNPVQPVGADAPPVAVSLVDQARAAS